LCRGVYGRRANCDQQEKLFHIWSWWAGSRQGHSAAGRKIQRLRASSSVGNRNQRAGREKGKITLRDKPNRKGQQSADLFGVLPGVPTIDLLSQRP